MSGKLGKPHEQRTFRAACVCADKYGDEQKGCRQYRLHGVQGKHITTTKSNHLPALLCKLPSLPDQRSATLQAFIACKPGGCLLHSACLPCTLQYSLHITLQLLVFAADSGIKNLIHSESTQPVVQVQCAPRSQTIFHHVCLGETGLKGGQSDPNNSTSRMG